MLQTKISPKIIGRLSRYRRLISKRVQQSQTHIFSHELAAVARATPSQVRRDLMVIGYDGIPSRGYEVAQLVKHISAVLDAPHGRRAIIVGVGNLGTAILSNIPGRVPNISIVAAFDVDPRKCGRLVNGIPCHAMTDLETVIAREGIRVAIVAVPARAAADVAHRLARAGVTGILSFSPTPLPVSSHVFVEDVDMIVALEKVAYFAGEPAETSER